MKAERRHELKENSLVRNLRQLPEVGKKYQSQILLAVILIALVVVLVRVRMNSTQERTSAAQESLAQAGDDLRNLQRTIGAPESMAGQVIQRREGLYGDGIRQANEVLEKAPDSQTELKTQALVYKGDLNFEMANFPDFAAAATQPSLRPAESRDDLLNGAEEAYNQVLQNYADNKLAATTARFGLAAIAEDRAAANPKDSQQWDNARKQYQAILDSQAAGAYKNLANQRLKLLPQLEQPLIIGLMPPGSTRPTTSKSLLGPEYVPGAMMPVPTTRTSATGTATRKN